MAAPRGRIRADAQRNRERLIEVAAVAFAEGGVEVSLEGIAADAGVGIGTLYRHFPTRAALAEAVHRDALMAICDEAPSLLPDRAPLAALREWMGIVIDYMADHPAMALALPAVLDAPLPVKSRLVYTVDGLLAGAGGADDVLTAVCAISVITAGQTDRGRAQRLADLFVDGLRVRLER